MQHINNISKKLNHQTFHLIVALMLLCISTPLEASNSLDQYFIERIVTLNLEDVTLHKAIQVIEKEANVGFTYNPNHIPLDFIVNIKVKDESVRNVCDKLFTPINVNFKIYEDKEILLTYNPIIRDTSSGLSKDNEQRLLQGMVLGKSGESLIGAAIQVSGTTIGTTTDAYGLFKLEVDKSQTKLEISFTGCEKKLIEVDPFAGDELLIQLDDCTITLDQIVVGASRNMERFVEAPVTIEKLDGLSILESTSESCFEAMANLKGVHIMKGSLSGPVMNTRGFANMNNLRFLMHLDGMDVTSPGYGVYANVGGVSNLDLQSTEIIPGSYSALYGANAFNGILLVKSKDPFLHESVGAQIRSGATHQSNVGINAYNNFSFRFAKKINEKLAFKIDFEALFAKDWLANDYTQRNPSLDPISNPERNPSLISKDQASYDGVNIFGDAESISNIVLDADTKEVTTSNGVTFPWSLGTLSRTGYTEQELFDNKISNNRINVAIHYKIDKDWRLEALYKRGVQDLVLRHTTQYPFRNFTLEQQKLELRGKGLTARVYTHWQEPKEVWTTLFTASDIQRELLRNEQWGQRFIDAYYGEVPNVTEQSIESARVYADDGMAPVGSPQFQQALRNSVNNFKVVREDGTIGSRLYDNSWLWHTDIIYDFSRLLSNQSWKLTLGGSFRRYTIRSEGSLFNDNKREEYTLAGFPDYGFDGNINLTESGVFGQIVKSLMDKRLNLSMVARLNGHSEFKSNFTPQLSTVYALDSKRNHYLRSSFTTGVRNPGIQEQYLNFVLSPNLVIIGGLQDNFDNYLDLFNGMTGDDLKREFKEQLGYDHKGLKPERNTTFEVGYKGLLFKENVLIDVNGYHTVYKNFIERANLSIETPRTGIRTNALYANIEDNVRSFGFGISLEMALDNQYILYSNYNYANFELNPTPGKLADLGFISPAFNTPKNRINCGLRRRNISGGIGFDIAARYASEWVFVSPVGKGLIPSYYTVDASISYRWKDFNISLNATNVNRNEYKSIIGGPEIGSIYTVGLLYNKKMNSKNKIKKGLIM